VAGYTSLYTVDIDSGATTEVGNPILFGNPQSTVHGLAYHNPTRTLFGVAQLDLNSQTLLATLDTANGTIQNALPTGIDGCAELLSTLIVRRFSE